MRLRERGTGHFAREHEERESPLGEADFVTVAKARWALKLPSIHERAVLRRDVVNLDRQIAVNNDRAVTTGNGCVVNDDVVVREPADAVQANFERDLSTTIEKPAVHTPLSDGNFARSEGFQFAVFGPERNTDFAGDGMPASRMFDAAASGAKRIATRVSFEVDAQ